MITPVTPARNGFYDIFSGDRRHIEPTAPFQLPAPKSAPVAPKTAAIKEAATSPTPPPTVDTSWFRPSTPVSLAALEQALQHAGLDPTRFSFEQVEADGKFPGHAVLDYTTHQLVIRGPHGAAMFDRDLALRTPWVTAVELRTYGIA
jgi:hypothetical protein